MRDGQPRAVLQDHVHNHEHARDKPIPEAGDDAKARSWQEPGRDEPEEDASAAAANREQRAGEGEGAGRVSMADGIEGSVEEIGKGRGQEVRLGERREHGGQTHDDGDDTKQQQEPWRERVCLCLYVLRPCGVLPRRAITF